MQSEVADDPYAVLSLSRTADADELKRTYRKLSMAWHPDRHAGGTDEQRREAERRFKLINSAYVAVGEMLRARGSAPQAGLSATAPTEAAVVEQADTRVEAIRSVVASAALKIIPNVPRHAYWRVVAMVENLLIDTIAVGERAFVSGFDTAVRDAMIAIGMDTTLRAEALKVLDAAADDLQWRGKGADPATWQALLRPLERARGATPLPGTHTPSRPVAPEDASTQAALLRQEPVLVLLQGALAVLAVLMLLPFVSIAGVLRLLLVVLDLAALGYITFGPRP